MSKPRGSRVAWLVAATVYAELRADRIVDEFLPADPHADHGLRFGLQRMERDLRSLARDAARAVDGEVEEFLATVFPRLEPDARDLIRRSVNHLVWERAATLWPCPQARFRRYTHPRPRMPAGPEHPAVRYLREVAFPGWWSGTAVPPYR